MSEKGKDPVTSHTVKVLGGAERSMTSSATWTSPKPSKTEQGPT